MPERFSWVPDLEQGEWLRPLEAERFGSILSIVPRGFEAYARVFHPVDRDRPRETGTWQGLDEATYFDGVGDIAALLEMERTTWGNAAASFGTTMHPEAQYARLVRRDHGSSQRAIGADGWRYGDPREGCLDATSLTAASVVLARHTATPADGIAAVWDGWGGLVSSAGVAYLVCETPSAQNTGETVGQVAGPPLLGRLVAALGQGISRSRSMIGSLPGLARHDPKPGSGLLAREVAAGPRFALHGGTGRNYVLFEAGATDFAEAGWPGRAPWVDEVGWAQSPSILWPEDHAWVLATEIDFDSTIVAGTTALIRELVRTSGLEALPIRADADLTWDGDVLNRPK